MALRFRALEMTNEQRQFHIEEYKLVRQEINDRRNGVQTLEFYAVSAMAAIYAWLATNDPSNPFYRLAVWAPVMFPPLVGIRSFGAMTGIMRLAAYCRQLEREMRCGSLPGWETQRDLERGKGPWAYSVSVISFIFWAVLFGASLAFALMGWRSAG